MENKKIPVLEPDDFGRRNFFGNNNVIDFKFPVNKLFHINRIEDHIDLIKLPMPLHRKTVFVFIFFLQGSTIRTKGLDTYTCGENTFFFLPPYQSTSRKYQNLDSKGFFCHFDAEIFQNSSFSKDVLNQFGFLDFLGNPLVKIDDSSLEIVKCILERIEKEYLMVSKKLDLELISSYLISLFMELKSFYPTDSTVLGNSAQRITQFYKNALMQNIYNMQKVSQYADLLAVTTDYLNRCVKSTTGNTARQLLEDMVVLETKILLNQTNYNISEIAFKVGKENVSDFIRFFKFKTGLTPKQYRQRLEQTK